MKVKLEKEYKSIYTLDDLDRAKAVIKYEKEYDEETPAVWAEMAIREALKNTGHCLIEILKATATTATNGRAFNRYDDGSGNMDVWIEATAETTEGFIKIGAYLTDIWNTGADDYREHMYIKRCKPIGA